MAFSKLDEVQERQAMWVSPLRDESDDDVQIHDNSYTFACHPHPYSNQHS